MSVSKRNNIGRVLPVFLDSKHFQCAVVEACERYSIEIPANQTLSRKTECRTTSQQSEDEDHYFSPDSLLFSTKVQIQLSFASASNRNAC